MDSLSVLQMIQISDSLFPIGAFTLSNGLETFVDRQRLASNQELEKYLQSYLAILPYNDLGVMLLAYQYAEDKEFIRRLDALSMALKIPQEVRNGTQKLCRRFLKLWSEIRQYPDLQWYQQQIGEKQCMGNHAVAVGLYSHEIGLSREEAGAIYSYSLLTAIVTNAVKTVPLSQIAGQKILHQMLERVPDAVEKALQISLDELGIGGTEFDIAAMNHEMLYSRLYMS